MNRNMFWIPVNDSMSGGKTQASALMMNSTAVTPSSKKVKASYMVTFKNAHLICTYFHWFTTVMHTASSQISIHLKFLHRQTINTSANTVQVEDTNVWFNEIWGATAAHPQDRNAKLVFPHKRQWLSVGNGCWPLVQVPGQPHQSPSCVHKTSLVRVLENETWSVMTEQEVQCWSDYILT